MLSFFWGGGANEIRAKRREEKRREEKRREEKRNEIEIGDFALDFWFFTAIIRQWC